MYAPVAWNPLYSLGHPTETSIMLVSYDKPKSELIKWWSRRLTIWMGCEIIRVWEVTVVETKSPYNDRVLAPQGDPGTLQLSKLNASFLVHHFLRCQGLNPGSDTRWASAAHLHFLSASFKVNPVSGTATQDRIHRAVCPEFKQISTPWETRK